MENTNIFEQATRKNLTFQTPKGVIIVNDLWNLSLTNLDKTAVNLFKELQEGSEVSFLSSGDNKNSEVQLKFDVVKYILDTKKAEQAAAKQAASVKDQKDKLARLIADKEDEQLKGKSIEELKAEMEKL